jgi:subtilase family serine protease
MRTSDRTTALVATAVLAALLCLAILLLGPAGSANAATRSQRVGIVPALPHGSDRLGRLAAHTGLSVDVTLAPRDPAQLSRFAQAVSTPGSRQYHDYLSVAAFRRRFAPSPAQLAQVRRGLRAAGLVPQAVSANGLLIKIRAPAGEIARAFHTRLVGVRLPGGRLAYANTRAPQFSGGLAGLIQGVVGLNDLSRPHALGLEWDTHRDASRRGAIRRAADSSRAVGAGAVTPCPSATTAAQEYGAFTADQIASVYGFSSLYAGGDQGAGQTVALLEFEPYLSSDIATYNACYGINGASSSDVSQIDVGGGLGSGYSGGPDGSGEAILDIEQILSLAPAAKVDVYEAPNSGQGELDAFTAMVQNPAVKVISTSWGECERLNGSSLAKAENTILQEAAAQGQSVFAAAGDRGSTDCAGASSSYGSSLAVDDPGSQPYVTSVGGTKLLSASDPSAQSTWNESGAQLGAGGGGLSLQWAMPSYQSGAAGSLGVISANSSASPCAANTGASGTDCREVPDVSADADPESGYVVYFSADNEHWAVIGGTSAAVPVWAAMTALANASTYCGTTSVGFANPILYGLADNASDYGADFSDITSGNTDYTPSGYSGGLYPATTGYDLATGLGTPKAASLVPAMCVAAGGPGTAPTVNLTPTSTATSPGTSSSSSFSGSGSSAASSPTTTTITASSGTIGTTGFLSPVSRSGSGTGTSSSGAGSTGSGAINAATTTPACHLTHLAGAVTVTLNARHVTAQRSLALRLPSGCGAYVLHLHRRVSSSEGHRAGALDVLKLQILNRSGEVLGTLATLSNAEGARGDGAMALNLAGYCGEGKLTLRLLGIRRGSASTEFRLTTLWLNLS